MAYPPASDENFVWNKINRIRIARLSHQPSGGTIGRWYRSILLLAALAQGASLVTANIRNFFAERSAWIDFMVLLLNEDLANLLGLTTFGQSPEGGGDTIV